MIFNLTRSVPNATPTMYSYNGTVLPPLPDYDKEQYPYAYIGEYGGEYRFFATNELKYSALNLTTFNASTPVCYLLEDGKWVWVTPTTVRRYIIWSNVDVYYADGFEDVGGTLYLSASEPTPFYE